MAFTSLHSFSQDHPEEFRDAHIIAESHFDCTMELSGRKRKTMVKVTGLYANIWDLDKFEEYYTKIFIPKILSVSGVIKMDFTSLYHSSDKQPQGLNNIHVITETYFESLEVMKEILSSEEGVAITNLITSFSDESTYIASYMSQEKVVYAPKWIDKKAKEGEVIEIVDLDNFDLL